MYEEIYHHGIEGQRWGVRNGPPYPLKESLSVRVGRKRAMNRDRYIEQNTKKNMASASLAKQLDTLNLEDLRRQANDILKSDERLESFGRQTIINRAAAFGAGHTAALGLAYVLSGPLSIPLTVAAAAGSIPIGASWIYYKYSTR